MAEILHTLFIKAPLKEVFNAVAAPEGLDLWWTDSCKGVMAEGQTYQLYFNRDYQWEARVTRLQRDKSVRYEITKADADWTGTLLQFDLHQSGKHVRLDMSHSGWKEANDHFRISSYCWATYLRILKRNLELGEFVPYDERDLS